MKKLKELSIVGCIILLSGGCVGDPTFQPAPTQPVKVTQKEPVSIWLKMTKNEVIKVDDLKLYKKTIEGGVTLQSDTTQVDVFDFSLTPVGGNEKRFIFKNFKTNYAFTFEVFTKDSLAKINGITNYLLFNSGYNETNKPLIVKLI